MRDWVTGEYSLVPLAGPANRQGRIAADNIVGRDSTFRGVQATSVVGIFGMTLASTGEMDMIHLCLPCIVSKSCLMLRNQSEYDIASCLAWCSARQLNVMQ